MPFAGVYITRAPAILADILVIYFTWARTWQQVMAARRFGLRVPLSYCILRDGTLYFIAMLLPNVVQVFADLGFLPSLAVADFVQALPSLQIILIQRFLINLRESSGFGAVTTIGTSSGYLGNIGESLRFARDGSDDGSQPVGDI
ncbi:hypothetical protein PHLGIDRAFT_251995 [Phlebiopsis gigantea 11061_1 CR5-6]|uniref:Uncharacterized protein n=1 Tax=Phlebiopsis gigantea (strain 11061_1 CR5-6) TaxID=745531 RepID=A0A0C3RSB1_PHLG1|nr:hypothetical protein PHLGIDRAFT_251995 [Phlebiopsis gigantea 11061_1 CR5-6]